MIVHEQDVNGAILEAAHEAGLLVVGAHGHRRIAHTSCAGPRGPQPSGARPFPAWCWLGPGAPRTATPPWSRPTSWPPP